MRSKLAIAVTLSGWLFVIMYILYDYSRYGSDLWDHLFVPRSFLQGIFHIMVFAVPIASTLTGYLISQRKKLLEKTMASERMLKHAAREWAETFDSMPYGVMLVDTEFNIIRANKYIAELSGIPIKELVFNKKCYKLLHRQDRPLDNCPLKKSKESHHTETIEYYNPAHSKYFMSSVSPMIDAQGNIMAFSHAVIDITDLKNKEEKLIQSKDAFLNILKDVHTAHNELQKLYQGLVVSFANAIDAKSKWTAGHSERVTNYALAIAKEMGVDGGNLELLRTAGLLHDIGKIGTYDAILDKPGKLTGEEFELVKRHPLQAEMILSPIKGLEEVIPIIRSHHEKLDGTGYPDGLKGDEIPLLSKILCVVDSYDSMTSDRPYRPSPGREYAISELKRCSGTQFDHKVVEAFLRVLEKEETQALA